MLKRLKPIINTVFLKTFFPPNPTCIEMQPFEHHLFITFLTTQPDHPYQEPVLTKTATSCALNRGRAEVCYEFSRNLKRQNLAVFLLELSYGSDPQRKTSDEPYPALLLSLLPGLGGPWAPAAALLWLFSTPPADTTSARCGLWGWFTWTCRPLLARHD